MPPDPTAPVALDGRHLGRRGAETRRRLLAATGALLETRGVRELRAVDVAREVGASPATFYQYFRGVEDAVLALAAEVGEESASLGHLLEEPWPAGDGLAHARRLVDGFLGYWDAHRAVLRTRNLCAQEGDERFRRVRNTSLRPFLDGLAERLRDAQRAGRVPPELAPVAAASALVAMMERMAAFHADLAPYGVTRAEVVETTARIIAQTISGPGAAVSD